MQVHAQIDHRVELAVHHVESAREFAAWLAAGSLARFDGGQKPLPQRALGILAERLEHRVRDLLAHDGVRRHHHVGRDAVAGPRLVPGARARRAEAGDVETTQLSPLDVLIAGRDLVQDTRRGIPGTQQVQSQPTEPGIRARLGDDGADARLDVDASRAHGHLARRDRDPEHAGALAPADQGEGRELDADRVIDGAHAKPGGATKP
jgi:hypothetical protein